MSKKKKKGRNLGKAGPTLDEKIVGSEKCILKAIQLMATIDELEKRQIPERGWVDDSLDKFVRGREVDPFSRPPFQLEVMVPPEYGFKSLVCETFFSQALAWWAKAQNNHQQPDKYLSKGMYASALWYDHFMGRRNNLGSHHPNDERRKVPGDTWLIARGYYPFGDKVIAAFKYMLSESMALLVPPQDRETTLSMCLGAFGIGNMDISNLQPPSSDGVESYSAVIKETSRMVYLMSPMPNGNWVCEAWDMDQSNEVIQGGRHISLSSEVACITPQDALMALAAQMKEEQTTATQAPQLSS